MPFGQALIDLENLRKAFFSVFSVPLMNIVSGW
jgi:hypothetical protein